MATFVELSGGRAIPASPGISLVPTFTGRVVRGHRELFNEHFGARYAREGDWKVVCRGRDSTWRLFNLARDRAETHDLAPRFPQIVTRLDSLWRQWANTHAVYPKPKTK